MTPYQTPHQPTTTPRYGQATPSHLAAPSASGPFLHPGSVTPSAVQRTPSHHHHGHSRSQHHSSPAPSPRHTASPRHHGREPTSEPMDWQKAAEAWARLKSRDSGAKTTPRYDEAAARAAGKAPSVSKSPRSVRSTPRTNTSPHSMSIGDATPLYDEN